MNVLLLLTLASAPLRAQVSARPIFPPATAAWTQNVKGTLTTVTWADDDYIGRVTNQLKVMEPAAQRAAVAPLVAQLAKRYTPEQFALMPEGRRRSALASAVITVNDKLFIARTDYADEASSEHNGIAKVTDALSKLKRLRADYAVYLEKDDGAEIEEALQAGAARILTLHKAKTDAALRAMTKALRLSLEPKAAALKSGVEAAERRSGPDMLEMDTAAEEEASNVLQ